jgi:hypothetical protein
MHMGLQLIRLRATKYMIGSYSPPIIIAANKFVAQIQQIESRAAVTSSPNRANCGKRLA